MKKQVYLHFSEAPPKFKGYAYIKDSARREKYLVSTSESRKHLNFLYWARPDRELIEQAKTEGRSNPYRVFPVQSRLDCSSESSGLESKAVWTEKGLSTTTLKTFRIFLANLGRM